MLFVSHITLLRAKLIVASQKRFEFSRIVPSNAALLRSLNMIAEVKGRFAAVGGRKNLAFASGESVRIAKDISEGPLTLLSAE